MPIRPLATVLPSQVAIKYGVKSGQLLTHPRVCQNDATHLNQLTRLDHKAALPEKWLGGETDIGEQLGDATAGCRLMNMHHERSCHTTTRIRARDKEMVDIAGRLKVCISRDVTGLGQPGNQCKLHRQIITGRTISELPDAAAH